MVSGVEGFCMAEKNYSEEFKADAVALFLSTPSATYVSVAGPVRELRRGPVRPAVRRR